MAQWILRVSCYVIIHTVYLYTTYTHNFVSPTGWNPTKHWLAVTSILLIVGAVGVAVPLALRVADGECSRGSGQFGVFVHIRVGVARQLRCATAYGAISQGVSSYVVVHDGAWLICVQFSP